MKDKLEVGMYVRTKWGIAKIREISEETIYVDTCFQPIDETRCYKEDIIGEPSFNPIDLIEVGDYVNGREVVDIFYNANDEVIGIDTRGSVDYVESDIKSIVTKEQFESMIYKLEAKSENIKQ